MPGLASGLFYYTRDMTTIPEYFEPFMLLIHLLLVKSFVLLTLVSGKKGS